MVDPGGEPRQACAVRKAGGADGGGSAAIAGGSRQVWGEDWRSVYGAKPSPVVARAGTGAWRAHRKTSVGGLFIQLLQRESGECAEFDGVCRRGADGYRLLPGSNVTMHFCGVHAARLLPADAIPWNGRSPGYRNPV